MQIDSVLTPTWRCVHFLEPDRAAALHGNLGASGLHIVTVGSQDLLSDDGLLATLGEVFRFPDYYGHNYNALNECLRDLSWLPAPGYVLCVTGAERLWRESPTVAGHLVRTWLFCAEYWSARQPGFHQQPRPTPFHLLMVW
jgi:Barstar (barnase inhibitor)